MIPEREKFIVRLPSHLHARIKSTAKEDKRSMNNEIVDRLEKSFASTQTDVLDEKIKLILLQNIDALERQIETLQAQTADPEK